MHKKSSHHTPVAPKKAPQFSWRSPEHLYKKKTARWYVAVGIFFLFFIVLFLLVQFWFAAAVVIVSYWLFLRYAEERPRTVDYKIDDTGVKIGERLISYSEIRSFSVDIVHNTPIVLLKTNASFAMPVTLVVKDAIFDDLVEFLVERIPVHQEFSLLRWLTHMIHY